MVSRARALTHTHLHTHILYQPTNTNVHLSTVATGWLVISQSGARQTHLYTPVNTPEHRSTVATGWLVISQSRARQTHFYIRNNFSRTKGKPDEVSSVTMEQLISASTAMRRDTWRASHGKVQRTGAMAHCQRFHYVPRLGWCCRIGAIPATCDGVLVRQGLGSFHSLVARNPGSRSAR